MLKKLILALLFAAPAFAQGNLSGINGECAIPGQQAMTQGLPSTGTRAIGSTTVSQGAGVIASYPQCQVTVYLSGTTTKPTIYSDNLVSPTPRSNPFIANTDASWAVFVNTGGCYDIVMGTGVGPSMATRSLSDVCTGGGGGTSILLQSNGITNGSQSKLNLHSSDASVTITDDGIGDINLQSAGGSGGSSTTYIPLENCAPDQTGNSFYNVATLTSWFAGHWEFSTNTTTYMNCMVRIPHALATTPNASIVLELAANDSTAGHTANFQACDNIVTATASLNVGALSCAANQAFTTTTTAYGRDTLSYAVQSTVNADNLLVVKIATAPTGTQPTNNMFVYPYLKIDQTGGGGGGGGGSTAFSSLTSGANGGAAMFVGTGASLAPTGSGTILATTANALAANPADCAASQFANSIAANGDLGCSPINFSQLAGTLSIGQTPLTTAGDILYVAAGPVLQRLAKGVDGQFLSLTSGIPVWVTGAGGGLVDPGSNGVIKRTALNTTAIAGFADFIAAWSGTCNSTTYPNGAGACTTPPGTLPGALKFVSTYGTAQAALNALSVGDTLLVDGPYPLCSGTLATANVTITAGNQGGVLSCATANVPVVTISTNGVEVSHLNIKHITNSPTLGGDGIVVNGNLTGTYIHHNLIQLNYNGANLGDTTNSRFEGNYVQLNNNDGVHGTPSSARPVNQWFLTGNLSQKNLGWGYRWEIPNSFVSVQMTGPWISGWNHSFGNALGGFAFIGSAATTSGIGDIWMSGAFSSQDNGTGFYFDPGPNGARNIILGQIYAEQAGTYAGVAGFSSTVQTPTNAGYGIYFTSSCDATPGPVVTGAVLWENSDSGIRTDCPGTNMSGIQAFKNGLALSGNSYQRAGIAIRASNVQVNGAYFRDGASTMLSGFDISNSGNNIILSGICDSSVATCLQKTTTPTKLIATILGQTPWNPSCNGKGLGDGFNAIPAQTYPQFSCVNNTGYTVTLTGLRCWTDNAGTSTLAAANNAGTALLTGPVTCNNTKASGGAAGTQSATVTLANGDGISFSFVADGTSKQTNWTVSGVY